MIAVFDIEANGLTPDKVWCVAVNDNVYVPDEIEQALNVLSKADLLIGHNVLSYDLPVLHRLYGFEYDVEKVYDTFIMSRLLQPDRGYHSLEEWGNKLGVKKVEDLDWNHYDPRMLDRCLIDVQITKRVYDTLKKEEAGHDWSQAKHIEHWIAYYHAKQCENGVKLDVEAAQRLLEELVPLHKEAVDKLKQHMPWIVKQGTTHEKPFTKAGTLKHYVQARYGDVVWGPCTNVDITEPNPDSPEQVKQWLLSIGWEPTEYTDKGSPKITDDSIENLPEAEPIKTVNILRHRIALLKGLLENVRDDGRVAADGIPLGTPTGRYTHRVVVNIPRVGTPYGAEFRSLFVADDGHVFIGSDASALEARCEAHYVYPYDREYALELIEGDIHTKTAEKMGVDRATAKMLKYACTYGASPTKIAKSLKVSKKEGKKIYDDFWAASTGLARLKEKVSRAMRRGYLKGIDGRKLMVRSEHSAVNLLFQSMGAIVVKKATLIMNEELRKAGIKYKQVIHMHDEFVLELPETEDLTKAEKIVRMCWQKAGEYFHTNVPIIGDVKIGKNWKEVH